MITNFDEYGLEKIREEMDILFNKINESGVPMKKQDNKELNDLYQKIVELHNMLKDPSVSAKEKSKIRREFLKASRNLKQMADKNTK